MISSNIEVRLNSDHQQSYLRELSNLLCARTQNSRGIPFATSSRSAKETVTLIFSLRKWSNCSPDKPNSTLCSGQ
ncbi:hypothetical protein P4S81_15595 [Pseudoalteromonas sp. B28]